VRATSSDVGQPLVSLSPAELPTHCRALALADTARWHAVQGQKVRYCHTERMGTVVGWFYLRKSELPRFRGRVTAWAM